MCFCSTWSLRFPIDDGLDKRKELGGRTEVVIGEGWKFLVPLLSFALWPRLYTRLLMSKAKESRIRGARRWKTLIRWHGREQWIPFHPRIHFLLKIRFFYPKIKWKIFTEVDSSRLNHHSSNERKYVRSLIMLWILQFVYLLDYIYNEGIE